MVMNGLNPYGMIFFNPSSTVKTAPHLGHFTFVSFDTPAQPKENVAKTANANITLISFLTPLHLLSFFEYFELYKVVTCARTSTVER